jgi:CHASE2 domain-containing sensor protein
MESNQKKSPAAKEVAASGAQSFWIWFATTIFLFLLSAAAIRTDAGKLSEVWSFGFLQGFLNPFEKEGLDVVIVDAENLKPQDSGIVVTPRADLEKLIAAIAIWHPKAIAVDIDFGMKDGDFRRPSDPTFFDNVLSIGKKQKVPIFLAVDKTLDGTSAGPLGLARWDVMAIGAHSKDANGHPLAIPFWYIPAGYSKPLPNLAVAVALAYLNGREVKAPPLGVQSLVNSIDIAQPADTSKLAKGSWAGYSTVNYSKSAQLFNERIRVNRPFDYIPQDRVRDKIIIIGFANPKQTMDRFHTTPLEDERAGVIFQGAAAYTLAVEPVYEFRPEIRVALDFLFSFAGFLFFSHKIKNKKPVTDAIIPFDQKIAFAAAFIVFFLGVVLVIYSRVLWLDFMVVVASLLLHPWLANILEKWRNRPRGSFAKKEEIL